MKRKYEQEEEMLAKQQQQPYTHGPSPMVPYSYPPGPYTPSQGNGFQGLQPIRLFDSAEPVVRMICKCNMLWVVVVGFRFVLQLL